MEEEALMKLYDRINNHEVYIIAEMSANHGGKKEVALQIIEEAAKAGADCVKIQTYTADTLTIDCKSDLYKIHGGLWDGFYYYDLYQQGTLPWEWHQELKEKCEEVGVDFLSTPFDFSSVDFLEKLDVECYKIASYELNDIPLIEYIASKGKPIIMSVGMGTEEEIRDALEACKRQKNEQVIILKCCSQYPAEFSNMNLKAIPLLQEKFKVKVGLSDHSFGSLAPVIATSLGACVIEKHVCLDDDQNTIDKGFSMHMNEFAKLVEDVRNTQIILGKPTLERTEAEEKGTKGRRSLVAIKKINKGEVFTSENIKSVRPAIGISPKYYQTLLGKVAKRSYEFGDPIQQNECDD